MKPFPLEPDFKPGEVGFDDKDADRNPLDALNRKPLGQRLTDLVDRVEQPMVIALDGSWGSGKSHFLKLWTGAHSKELGGKARVIYFDAFEHDFLDDPLTGLVAHLVGDTAPKRWPEKAISTLRRSAIPLTKLTLRAAAAVATYGATLAAEPILDKAIEKVGGAADESVAKFWQREADKLAAMRDFRQSLEDLTQPDIEGAPPIRIVFIIDELDRCRPDYALSLLEIVKHFFSVPNVHFVLGANMRELENSVRARYGSGVDAARYLQKFVTLRMNLPRVTKPDGSGSAALIYLEVAAKRIAMRKELIDELVYQLVPLAARREITLRDAQRVLASVSLLPEGFHNKKWAIQLVVMTALLIRVLDASLYGQLKEGQAQFGDIANFFRWNIDVPAATRPEQAVRAVWRRVLEDEPGEETTNLTEGLFDFHFRASGRVDWLKYWLDELVETFTLPGPA